jgi:hypothetical protein
MISKTLEAVINDMKNREKLGKLKYKCTLDRQDLTLKDWLQHAYEENLDAALYLKRAIREIENLSI